MSIIIIGAGEIGYHIANELNLENRNVTLIDPDRERIRFLEESGEDLNIIYGSGSSPEILKQAGIEKAEMLIAVANNDEINITACHLASQMNKNIMKIARIRDVDTQFYGTLIMGDPPIIDSIINKCTAFIAAWLPGTEADGVADVLFGDYSPTGKLTHSWPRSMDQIPINIGDNNYDPLFTYGFGLSY